MFWAKKALACAIVAFVLAACVQGPLASPDSISSGLPTLTVNDAVYQLGAGDQLGISVYGEDQLAGEFVISPEGTIGFPLIGEVQAAGLTVAEFSAHLEDRLKDGYLRDPRANVSVLNYRPYYIIGEVSGPGSYPYSSGLTVFNAIAIAGGFTYRADQSRVFIKHAEDDREIEYGLTTITPIQPGDIVRVLERRF